LGGAPLEIIDDAGHDVLLEQPAALAAALHRLMREPWPLAARS
jgi:pimeloyl-ACP methyl ester carboxylesterase